MNRLLVVTTVDLRVRPNNREHHFLRAAEDAGIETVVVYRRSCVRRGLSGALMDAAIPRARIDRSGRRTLVAVNPILNHAEGMVQGVEHRAAGGIRSLLGVAGILKDVSTVLFLFLFALPRGRCDWAVAFGPWGAAAARLLRALGRIGGYTYVDRDYEPGFVGNPLRQDWITRVEIAGMRSADSVVTIGHRLMALRVQQGITAPTLIPTGVDVAQFSGPPRGEPGDVVLYAGNVAPWSGLDQVIAAMPAIRRARPATRLRIVGSGLPAYRAKLEALIDLLDLRDAVELTGAVPYAAMADQLRAASIGLAVFLPTPLRVYAAPLKLIEYMAAGLPTLGVAETETADLIARHDVGVACACEPEAIATAILDLLADRARYAAMSARAVAAAEAYDWSALMARELTLLEQAASGRRQPAAG